MEDDVNQCRSEPSNGNSSYQCSTNGGSTKEAHCVGAQCAVEPERICVDIERTPSFHINGGIRHESVSETSGPSTNALNGVHSGVNVATSGGDDEWSMLGAVGGVGVVYPALTNGSNGGARPKERTAQLPPQVQLPGSRQCRMAPAPIDSDDELSPSPVCHRRLNGAANISCLPVSHSASESDCNLDECVYTYKGDPAPPDHNRNHPPMLAAPAVNDEGDGGRESPDDLDFLEMDFDPSAFDSSDDDDRINNTVNATVLDWPLENVGSPVTVSPQPPATGANAPEVIRRALENGASGGHNSGSSREPTPSFRPDDCVRVTPPQSPPRSPAESPSPASSHASNSTAPNSPPSLSPVSSRASSPRGAVGPLQLLASPHPVRPAELRFNHLSCSIANQPRSVANSDDNLCASDADDDGERSPESNAVVGPGRHWAECKVSNRRPARYNLGSISAPSASPSEPVATLPHSRSDHSSLSSAGSSVMNSVSDKYQYCCSNDLSDTQQTAGCGERLRRREDSVFNIPGGGAADPNLHNAECDGQAEKDFMNGKDSTNTSLFEPEKVMIWSEMEAFTRQVTQIGRSACGATAVINVLLALGYSPDPSVVTAAVQTKRRKESAAIPEYLFSRAQAGATHQQLIDGVHRLTNGEVSARFFPMQPRRRIQLVRWLGGWLRRGAVPVATLNLQKGVPPQQPVPDAWHHQMAFGVGPQGVYLTNPLECVSASLLDEQLASEPVLLVRREDIVSRWRDGCSLHPLMLTDDPRWRSLNVLGQVVSVLREAYDPTPPGVRRTLTSHVTVPAWYRSGVTLFLPRASPHLPQLLHEPELPRWEDC